MISFKQFLNEALSVSNTHYKKYFDLVQSYVGANKRKEIVNGNDIKIIFLNGSKEIVTLNYELKDKRLELKSFIKDNKETNIDKEIRDTKSIRDLIGTPLDFLFSNVNDNNDSNDSNDSNELYPNIKRVNGKYQPKTKNELRNLCHNLRIHLGDIDTSLITDMSELFKNCHRSNEEYEGIEDWDVSNVTNMGGMFFYLNDFNRNLNKWDVSKVTNMACLFCHCERFNQPLNNWNVSKVANMAFMFEGAYYFNQPLDKWDVSKVTNFQYMFCRSRSFNQSLKKWNISKIADTTKMFEDSYIKDSYKPKI